MRIGVFGGTFDPPHLAHLILAAEACDQLSLDRLLWVLTPDPPHKQGLDITPLPQRLALLQAALADNPDFEISRVDIDRPPPHYAVDTLHLLRAAFPGAELVYLLGGDSLVDLPAWVRPQEFVRACDELGVMNRPGELPDLDALDAQLPGLAEKVRWVQAPLLEISGSIIRRRAAQGGTYRYYVLPAVYALIEEWGLYQGRAAPSENRRVGEGKAGPG